MHPRTSGPGHAVRASQNEQLIALLEAIAHPIHEAAGYQQVTTEEIRDATKKAHGAILEAIKKKDADHAQRRMAKHFGAYIEVAGSIDSKT